MYILNPLNDLKYMQACRGRKVNPQSSRSCSSFIVLFKRLDMGINSIYAGPSRINRIIIHSSDTPGQRGWLRSPLNQLDGIVQRRKRPLPTQFRLFHTQPSR